jgi:hypothetical protein
MLKDIFRVEDCPSSLGEFSSVWLQGKGPMSNRPLIFFFAGFAWAIWTMRNKMAIEKSFAKAPTDVLYRAVPLLQRWCVLLKEKDKDRINQALAVILIRRWLLMYLKFSLSVCGLVRLLALPAILALFVAWSCNAAGNPSVHCILLLS